MYPSMISEKKHAMAKYEPKLDCPGSIFVYLNILEQELVKTQMKKLLISIPRSLSLQNEYHFDAITARQYKRIDPNVNFFNELFFEFQPENGSKIEKMSNIIITLHFIQK